MDVYFYCQALELDPNDAVLYSNRAISRIHLGKYDLALTDSLQCIDLKPHWFKGYSNQGTALLRLGRKEEALTAYRRGLEYDPENQNLKERIREAEEAPAHYIPTESNGISSNRNGSLKDFLFGTQQDKDRTATFGIRFLIVLLCIIFILPVGYFRYKFYYWCHMFSMINVILHIQKNHRNISFSIAFAQEIMLDTKSHMLFFSLIFYFASPKTLSLMTLFIYYSMDGFDYLYQLLLHINPSYANKLYNLGMSLINKLTGDTTFSSFSYIEKRKMLEPLIQQFTCATQVYVGFFLILELMLPTRSFSLLLVYWNFIRFKTTVDYNMSSVFHKLDEQFLSYVNHRFCPGIVKSAYMTIRGLLKRLVTPQQ